MIVKDTFRIYLGTFLISSASLALEIALTRLLSVITWYHVAFFAVSTAMLGLTAGAVIVYLKPHWFTEDKLDHTVARACLGYAVATPCTLITLCITPVGTGLSPADLMILIAITLSCALPFFFSGIAMTAVITKYKIPIGSLYASDLAGAAMGCLLVLGGLEILDVVSLMLVCGTVAVLAAFSFIWGKVSPGGFRKVAASVLAILLVLALMGSFTPFSIHLIYVKGEKDDYQQHLIEQWNSYSRVVVYKMSVSEPQYWGASSLAPQDIKILQYRINIDGSAETTISRFLSMADIEYLRFDLTNIVHYLRPQGAECIIGAGGGRDIQSAILFGHEQIVAIEMNPFFFSLLQGEFEDCAGVAEYPGVSLIVDEARSYLSRTSGKFSVIQMSLVDTWAATGAGAFSLSENGLYTLEAWCIFMSHLSDDGIFTVTRWHNPDNPIETGRLLSLATATLLESGVSDPSQHIAIVATEGLATLLLSKQPFYPDDVANLKVTCSELEFEPVILPGVVPDNPLLAKIVSVDSLADLHSVVSGELYNLEPPTDENPYFFNMLKLNHLDAVDLSEPGVLSGNISATLTLLGLIASLLLACIITIVIPLIMKSPSPQEKGKNKGVIWPAVLYFSLLGAGFMFTEIALVQRMSIFLGHPIYALGVLLFTIIASSALGSLISERLPLTRLPWVLIYPLVISLAIIAVRFIMPALSSEMASVTMIGKIFVSILVITPLGLLLGVAFPTGMRLVYPAGASETPWYWALNGIMGVLASALAVIVSIYFSISTSLFIGAACYALLIPCLVSLRLNKA